MKYLTSLCFLLIALLINGAIAAKNDAKEAATVQSVADEPETDSMEVLAKRQKLEQIEMAKENKKQELAAALAAVTAERDDVKKQLDASAAQTKRLTTKLAELNKQVKETEKSNKKRWQTQLEMTAADRAAYVTPEEQKSSLKILNNFGKCIRECVTKGRQCVENCKIALSDLWKKLTTSMQAFLATLPGRKPKTIDPPTEAATSSDKPAPKA